MQGNEKKINIEILKPGEIHGRSRVTIVEYDHIDQAINCKKMLQNPIMQALFIASIQGRLTQLGFFVPLINNIINGKADITDDLIFCELGISVITDELKAYIFKNFG